MFCIFFTNLCSIFYFQQSDGAITSDHPRRPLISLDFYDKLILNLLENTHQRTPKGQSKMDNLEKLTKQKHNATCIGHHHT